MILNGTEGIGIKVVMGNDPRTSAPYDYPVICETLERIGIINRRKKKVYPSCYCIETEERVPDPQNPVVYTIAHFKELFTLQDKKSDYSEEDRLRLQTICYLLDDWGLVKVLNKTDIEEILHEKVSVLPFKQKRDFEIVHKFRMYNA